MTQCFIFINDLESNDCVGIKFYSKTGKFSEINKLKLEECAAWQANYATTIVIATNNFCVYSMNLPKISQKKHYSAIGYALEDRIISAKETIHIAYQTYNNQTNVVYCEKNFFEKLLHLLNINNISYQAITLDWAAIPFGCCMIIADRVLINTNLFCGELCLDDFIKFVKNFNYELIVYQSFSAGQKLPGNKLAALEESENIILYKLSSNYLYGNCFLWLANKFVIQNPINLLQNIYKPKNTVKFSQKHKSFLVKLYLFWIASLILVFSTLIGSQIIYGKYLDYSISKANIQQKHEYGGLLASNVLSWNLLVDLVKALYKAHIKLNKLTYKNSELFITFDILPNYQRNVFLKQLKYFKLKSQFIKKNKTSELWKIGKLN